MLSPVVLIQLVSGLALIASILVQAKGTGLGSAFGGSSEFSRSKRGVEKFLFIFTIVMASIFILSGMVNIFVS